MDIARLNGFVLNSRGYVRWVELDCLAAGLMIATGCASRDDRTWREDLDRKFLPDERRLAFHLQPV